MKAESLLRGALLRLDPADRVERALGSLAIEQPRVVLLALGKAARAMGVGAVRALGDRIADAVIVCPAGATIDAAVGTVVEAAHPRPDERSERAGRLLLAKARAAGADQHVVALISGGGSALAAVPAAELSLADKIEACDRVYRAGAAIAELNCVRKHLSQIKGGRLAAACPAPITTLVSSDVPGDDVSAVASGPTVADTTTFSEAVAVAEATCGLDALPRDAAELLRRGADGELPDTPSVPRPGDRAILVAGIDALVEAVLDEAASAGAAAGRLGVDLSGDVEQVAKSVATALAHSGGPACLVAGGEPTIAVPDGAGTGGRAHHLALLLARELSGTDGLEILVAGSDGIDGTSDAAGAVIDGGTWTKLDHPQQALARFDSATALAAAGCSVVTGPTGINHADVLIALRR